VGRLIEPFVGGGVVFFHLQPRRAVLADINRELIDIYRGIQSSPDAVWRLYRSYPGTKRGYNKLRRLRADDLTLVQRAARSLYLNRTCFKGMWRHNLIGDFNIGYGGQARRWAIGRRHLFEVSRLLRHASLKCCDFEGIVDSATPRDYLFLDPPYRPGQREQVHDHYAPKQFRYADHCRLARCLRDATGRGVRWSMTISKHRDILELYRDCSIVDIPRGTSRQIGVLTPGSGEVFITNHG
jgi:DNA adenine methylase